MFTRWVFLADMPIYAPFSEIHMVISATKKIPWAGDSKPGKPGSGDLTAPLLAHDLKALLMGKAQ
jgi:hypothetical protein